MGPDSPPWTRIAAAVVVRPRLWPVAVRQWFRIAPPGWWRQRPYLPRPPRRYVEFRFETAFGDAPARAEDVVAYLEWCRERERGRRSA
jgi:hypothetical protein